MNTHLKRTSDSKRGYNSLSDNSSEIIQIYFFKSILCKWLFKQSVSVYYFSGDKVVTLNRLLLHAWSYFIFVLGSKKNILKLIVQTYLRGGVG